MNQRLRFLGLAALVASVASAPALATPDASPAFDVQHFELAIPDTNPCTGSPMTVYLVEDFYVHVRPNGSLDGIIEVTSWTSDGYSNGGPRIIGSWIENTGPGTFVFSTNQHDRLANDAGQAIDVHVGVKIVVVDGQPVVFRADPPRLSCVGRP